jgi:hypothetical protein
MLERFKSKNVATALAVFAGGAGLAGCGGDKNASWRIGVTCPESSPKVHVVNLHQFADTAKFFVECVGKDNATFPSGIELLAGKGTTVNQPADKNEVKDVVTVDYAYATGLLSSGDPSVENMTIHEKDTNVGSVFMSGISKVESVRVGK